MVKEKIPVVVMSPVDVEALIEEDKRAGMNDAPKPFRFGYAIDVDIDIKKAGMKKELPNGDILWLLKIHSPDAYSINLIYDDFKLGNGSRFFIYNEDRTMVFGAFTPETSNNPSNKFATDLIEGNTVVLEYYEQKSSDDGVIHIGKVIHGYMNTFGNGRGLGDAADCNIDVMCTLGNNWTSERKAVCMIITEGYTASGCLINNTKQDSKPYILTARHHYFYNNGVMQTYDPATSIFRFFYWKPNCDLGIPVNYLSISGATLRAHYLETDFALLELNSPVPSNYNVYYAGWDRTTTPAYNATGIHHPRGDAMKISHEEHTVATSGSNLWYVQHFEQGTAQPGSSGSPLFNHYKRIVGQVSQGASSDFCDQRFALYGRFDKSWTGGGTNASRLSNWLDPNNTGVFVLDGLAAPCNKSYNNQTVTTNTTVTGCEITSTNVTVSNGANLTLQAQIITMNAPFTVNSGSSFILTH